MASPEEGELSREHSVLMSRPRAGSWQVTGIGFLQTRWARGGGQRGAGMGRGECEARDSPQASERGQRAAGREALVGDWPVQIGGGGGGQRALGPDTLVWAQTWA